MIGWWVHSVTQQARLSGLPGPTSLLNRSDQIKKKTCVIEAKAVPNGQCGRFRTLGQSKLDAGFDGYVSRLAAYSLCSFGVGVVAHEE